MARSYAAHYEIVRAHGGTMLINLDTGKSRTEWFFRIVASNGKTLCHSETYRTKRACLNGIRAAMTAKKVVEPCLSGSHP